MRSAAQYDEVLALFDRGLTDSEISRATGVPRQTVGNWRVAKTLGSPGRTPGSTGRVQRRTLCPRCGGRHLDERTYAYLLGQYLGDGSIVEMEREVLRLSITCALAYPGIVEEVAASMAVTRGSDRVGFAVRTGCVDVYSYWKHWTCLFPQHDVGPKHRRKIRLEAWQAECVERWPTEMLRGLIHSDGSRHLNTVVRRLASGPKTYRYPRYMFANASEDIRGIFTWTCDLLQISWTKANSRNVAVSRKRDVAFLDTFVGPKA